LQPKAMAMYSSLVVRAVITQLLATTNKAKRLS
jgi:hypothetical protein